MLRDAHTPAGSVDHRCLSRLSSVHEFAPSLTRVSILTSTSAFPYFALHMKHRSVRIIPSYSRAGVKVAHVVKTHMLSKLDASKCTFINLSKMDDKLVVLLSLSKLFVALLLQTSRAG